MLVLKMAQAKDKERFKGRNISVPSLSSDDANVNTTINTKDSEDSICCRECSKIVKYKSKA